MQKRRCNQSPNKVLWDTSRANAKHVGMVHTITPDDIPLPTHCALLGMELTYTPGTDGRGHRDLNRASIDRIDNSLGYIPGNVQVISWQANRLKGTLTSKQLIYLAKAILKMFSQEDQ